MKAVHVHSIRYHGTNCFFIASAVDDHLLAIDAGWPGTLYEYARSMKTIGCNLEQIRWAIVTHFHMDHAGLIGEFIQRGIRCFIFENQAMGIDAMEKTIEKNHAAYQRIDKSRLEPISTSDSRMVLEGLGVRGQVKVTDYHSPDSITFVSDEGEAIIGDLPPPGHMMPGDKHFIENWEIVRALGANLIYPSHAGIFRIDDITV